METSRELTWNIPAWYVIAMYLFLLASLTALGLSLIKKYKFVKSGGTTGGNKLLGAKELDWNGLLDTLLFQGKIPRDSFVGIFHGAIFYGFIVLTITTGLVAIHQDTPIKIFQGPFYILFSFLADIAGIAVLLGVGLAFYRRFILKPDYLTLKNSKPELFMYLTIITLVIVGYLLEGLRIYGTNMPQAESTWSPVGWFIASIFSAMSIQLSSIQFFHKFLWFIHMVSTMVFVSALGYRKFFHIIAAITTSLVSRKNQGAVLMPMNFENEEAETFGLGKASELTQKNRLDLIACVECGRCTNACPAQASGKKLNPKEIITKMRDFTEANLDGDLWSEKQLYEFNELDACTTCGACMEMCPMHIEHVNIIMGARRYKVLTLANIPPAAATASSNIQINNNPWGIAGSDRFKWASNQNVPIIKEGIEVDYLLFVGCAGSYDSENQKIVKDTMNLLRAAGVNFATLGDKEMCCGDPIRRFGDEYSFDTIAKNNIELLNKFKFKKIVTHCPHCMHTIGKEYSRFENAKFDVIHHSQLLAELLDTGKIKPIKRVEAKLTFHDPCYLGRHGGEYNSPRKILAAIPGITLNEMKKNKENAACCGMGGGNMWYELPEGEHLAINRLKQVAETKVPQLATACSYCLINFNSSRGQHKPTEELVVEDIASILAKSAL